MVSLQPIDRFCAQILAIDKGIRFAGMADKDGRMLGHVYRDEIVPLLTEEETASSVLLSTVRDNTRKPLEIKLGKALFSYTRYENVKRVTIPVQNGSEQQIFMVSFDANV